MESTTGGEHPAPTMAGAQAFSGVQMQPSSPASMHPLLLAAACKGDVKELSYLLNREETQAQPDMMPPQDFLDQVAAYASGRYRNGSLGFQRVAADLEEGTMTPASFLEGVNMEGDTALHVVAASGDDEIFLSCADLIHGKDRTFLSKQNTKGDTPLHCAVRAGHSQMASHLVALARSDSTVLEDLLRKENCRKETVLHEAVRIGENQMVKDLLEADPELACFPKEGSSPLYLAISLKEDTVAETLHEESKDKVLSYLGPNGQNALHAAVLRGPVLTRRLLEWNKDLATKADENGSTPLHFAAGRQSRYSVVNDIIYLFKIKKLTEITQLLEANTAALYQPDHQGLFPIHVAATVGERNIIALFVKRCHSSSRLRDAKGRTFLHVAVDSKKWRVVAYACQNASLECILNMQDNDGNTALHLAAKAMDLGMVCKLLERREVKMNLTNAKGQTPLDTAEYMIHSGWSGGKESVSDIHYLLQCTGATSGVSRHDHYFDDSCEKMKRVKADRESKQSKILSESSQSLLVGSVLVASVTFGAQFAMLSAAFAMPLLDIHHGGTPSFDVTDAFMGFVIADAMAFFCSVLATGGFMYSGNSKVDLVVRESYFSRFKIVMHVSIVIMVAAFGLGMLAVGFSTGFLHLGSGIFGLVYGFHFAPLQTRSATAIWIRKGPTLSLRFAWSMTSLVHVFISCIPSMYVAMFI